MSNIFITRENKVEIANVATHFAGIVFSFVALFNLRAYESDNYGLHFFILGLFAVYCASTLYHSIALYHLKVKMQVVDHLAIFLLIGGTHCPFIVGYTFGSTRIVLLAIIIALVVIGFVYKLLFFEKFKKISLVYYLALGWFAIIDIPLMWGNISVDCLRYIGIGGLFYTTGTIFYKMEKLPYHHAYWHIFVIFGSYFHYVAVLTMLNHPLQ